MKRPRIAARALPRTPGAARCPWCRALVGAARSVACVGAGCGAVYHDECWRECAASHRACAVWGCRSRHAGTGILVKLASSAQRIEGRLGVVGARLRRFEREHRLLGSALANALWLLPRERSTPHNVVYGLIVAATTRLWFELIWTPEVRQLLASCGDARLVACVVLTALFLLVVPVGIPLGLGFSLSLAGRAGRLGLEALGRGLRDLAGAAVARLRGGAGPGDSVPLVLSRGVRVVRPRGQST